MGTDNLFKKRRERDKVRKSEYKKEKANSFLIVTEGEKTEPSYFNGIRELIMEKRGGSIDIYDIPTIAIEGEGRCTTSLVRRAEEIIKKNNTKKSGYEKNDESIYHVVNVHDGANTAIRNAKRRMENFYKYEKSKPSEYDPGTTVHLLVEELLQYLEE